MAQEHQEYIQTKVNPIVENLVTQMLLERPDNPVPFMIRWLSGQSARAKEYFASLGVTEADALRDEVRTLREEVSALEARLQPPTTGASAAAAGDDNAAGDQQASSASAAPASSAPAEKDDEEESEDDAEEELPPPPESYLKKGARGSVSAEAYGEWNKLKEFTPPVHPKSSEQTDRILACLRKSLLFRTLEQKDLDVLVGAMVEKTTAAGEVLIKEGDNGDLMYMIESGVAECMKRIDGEDRLVKTCHESDSFGELALLYNCPRAATVVAKESLVLWQLDRETFNHIVRDASMKRREMHETFLKSVDLLKDLGDYERAQLAEALQKEHVPEGHVVLRQGDNGDRFYLVEAGELSASKDGKEVLQYKSGDYFGELALLNEITRQATVTARTDATLQWVDRKVFLDLLGPLKDTMDRKASDYSS